MADFYVNIARAGSGYAGTTGDPLSFIDFQERVDNGGTGSSSDNYFVSGVYTYSSGGAFFHNYNLITAWGSDPWRLKLTYDPSVYFFSAPQNSEQTLASGIIDSDYFLFGATYYSASNILNVRDMFFHGRASDTSIFYQNIFNINRCTFYTDSLSDDSSSDVTLEKCIVIVDSEISSNIALKNSYTNITPGYFIDQSGNVFNYTFLKLPYDFESSDLRTFDYVGDAGTFSYTDDDYWVIPYASPSGTTAGSDIIFSGITNIPAISGWTWDFDNGTTESGRIVTYSYDFIGSYNVDVNVSGNTILADDSGIYLDSYIIDDFGESTGISGFDPSYDPDFSEQEIVDCSGFMAVKQSALDDTVLPSGGEATISGRFDIQTDLAMGCTEGGNESIELILYRADNSRIHGVGWSHGLEYNGVDAGLADDDWVAGRRYTVRMTRGYQLDSFGNVSFESEEVLRSYYLDNWSGGSTNEWIEFSSSPESGSAYSDAFYIAANGADYNGHTNFKFQSDYGLPYSRDNLVHKTSVNTTSSTSVTISGLDYEYSGVIHGKGLIEASIGTKYTHVGPPPPGARVSTYTPILMNKRRYQYKMGNDSLQAKLLIMKGNQLSYLNNIDVEFWLTYEGDWIKYEDYTTNRYGMAHLKHLTSSVLDIDCCLGVARVIINGVTYNSNIVRFNFIQGSTPPEVVSTFEIDAGLGVGDRSTYDIFDGEKRGNTFDRMYGG